MAGGRPLEYKDAEELQEAIDSYFNSCNNKPTIAGLALALGFCSRKTFYNYEERPEFLHTIKSARLRIEDAHEKRMYENNPTGSIFMLKTLGLQDEESNTMEQLQRLLAQMKVVDFVK